MLKPHTRGYRERKDRTGFADKSLEKWHSGKATCDRRRSRRKWYSGILGSKRFGLRRLMKWFPKTHSPFPAVDRTGQYEFGEDGTDGIRTGVSTEEKEGSCVLKCEDGDLKMPDYTLEFK